MAGPGKPVKEFQEYLADPTAAHVGHSDYVLSPATAFLKYSVEAKSAIDLCIRKFPKKNGKAYTNDALDSLQHLTAAILPATMGHFETYERYLFAGMFDYSVHLKGFDVEQFFKRLNKESDVSIDPVRLSAYRSFGATSIGILLADSLTGWHDPEKVNKFFDAFELNRQLFAKDHCSKLCILWQLRHSIVHTGGTLTHPDAQKVDELAALGDKKVVFENNFIYEVSRKLHPVVKQATEGIGDAFKKKLADNVEGDTKKKIEGTCFPGLRSASRSFRVS